MKRPLIALLLLIAGFTSTSTTLSADETAHKVAIHVDENDPKRMNMALNNVANIRKFYDSKGEKIEIEVVAYGPGLHMLRADTSPVKDRIAVMSLEIDKFDVFSLRKTHMLLCPKQLAKKSS